MYLKCTRVSRMTENGVILLSLIVPFRRIANIVEKKKTHHFSNVTGNAVPVAYHPKLLHIKGFCPLTK